MTALEIIERLSNKSIMLSNLKYCLVDANKRPFKLDGTPARPNNVDDFVSFEELLQCDKLNDYVGLGVSIQASNICAIDVDHCFSIPNDLNSGDERAKYLLELFKDAYCEFSFSGTGLRIFFRHGLIENYSDKYYIKNEKYKVEYYQPGKSFRYVTITGISIHDNNIESQIDFSEPLQTFLDKYMEREIRYHDVKTIETETRSFEELMQLTKKLYRTDMTFQNLWFTNAPGSGKDESERDYHLVAYLFENVTQDHDMIKQIFEQSTFFKTKDYKHVYKWTNQNGRYFEYLYNTIRRTR